MGSFDGGRSSIFIVGLKNQWKDTGYGDFDLSLGYTHSSITDVSAATSSTASSSYKYTARTNYNTPEVGTSDYERVHRATVNATVTERFFGDLRPASIFSPSVCRASITASSMATIRSAVARAPATSARWSTSRGPILRPTW